MKKLFALIISVMALTGCDLDDNPLYYKLPDITNIAYTPELESITANDEVAVSATVINYYGIGYACVKYWVCDNTWGEQMPELKIEADVLYCWVEPQAEGEQGEWKKLATMKHSTMAEIVGSSPFKLEGVIPKQKTGKFVTFSVFCTNDYGINDYSKCYHYTVQ